jgi:hypothetical protein
MLPPFRSLLALAALVAFGASPRLVHAYSTPDAYLESAASGGGGGRWFSGSPADGWSCSVCHLPSSSQRQFPLYVTGLPLAGYTLAEAREVVLSWPEFAQRWREIRPDPTQAPAPEAPSPAVGLVAELVAESGRGSGTIEIRSAQATPGEQCEMTRPNLQPRLGVRLYQVRAGIPALLVKPDPSGTLRCESRNLGQRCIIALTSCGAEQVRFVWTPPSTQEGPIWFSAGFVASEALSGTPEHDAVRELSVPMVQAGTQRDAYQQELRGTCAVQRVSNAGGANSVLVLLAVALAAWRARRRRRARRVARALLPWLLVMSAGACTEHERVPASSYPSAGLYTPGSTLGASDPTDMPVEGAGLGNRCVALPRVPDAGPPPTSGSLHIEYTTLSHDGRYAPKNCTAVWLETPDGAYVATLELRAALRRPGLVYYQDHTCTEKPGPDVLTSATLTDHERTHDVMWSGVDFEGEPVADGPYKLFIEVTESDKEPGELSTFDITKGSAPYSMTLPVAFDSPLVQVDATWMVDE